MKFHKPACAEQSHACALQSVRQSAGQPYAMPARVRRAGVGASKLEDRVQFITGISVCVHALPATHLLQRCLFVCWLAGGRGWLVTGAILGSGGSMVVVCGIKRAIDAE